MKRFFVFSIYPAISLALHAAGLAGVGLAGMMWSHEEVRGGGAVAPEEVAGDEPMFLDFQIEPAEVASPEQSLTEAVEMAEPAPGPPVAAESSPTPVLPEVTPPKVDRLYDSARVEPRPAPARPAVAKSAGVQTKPKPQASGQPSAARREGTAKSPTAGIMSHASATYAPEPVYPADARRRRVEGSVVVRIAVSVSGRTDRAWIERSSGHADLDQAALSAAGKMRCVPAMRGGQPAAEQLRRTYTFRLKKVFRN